MKKVKKTVGIVSGAIMGLILVFFAIVAVTEYKPASYETVDVSTGKEIKSLKTGDSLDLVTWNIGWGALGDNADFFKDGGSMVRPSNKERVIENLASIEKELKDLEPDVIFMQELDLDASRSYHIDEKDYFQNSFENYACSFAYNHKCFYIPYPIPPLGHVESGELTLTAYDVNSAERYSLPYSFDYPVRVFYLKRCLLVSRIGIEDSDKELVLINLHLEAYDSGEDKQKQTEMLKELMEEEIRKGNYVIAGGDFNQSFFDEDLLAYPLLDEDYWECSRIDSDLFEEEFFFHSDNSTPTCRYLNKVYADADHDNFQYYMLDGFIVSSNLTVNECRTIDLGFVSSDHNPVYLNVNLNDSDSIK